jgi:hypothetical protein
MFFKRNEILTNIIHLKFEEKLYRGGGGKLNIFKLEIDNFEGN